VAPAIGPTVGGYFVDDLNWRLIFYINVPVGILGAIAAYFMLPRIGRVETHRFDYLGFITIAYGLFALLLATSKGQKWHWGSYPVLILLVSSALSLALFVVIENEVDYPLIDLRVLASWPFVNSLLLISVLVVGLFSVSFYLPQFLQNGQGLTALNAGELLLPQALVLAVLMPLAGRIYDQFGPRWPALIGLAINAYGTYLLTNLNVDMTRQDVIVWTIVRAFGTGLALIPIMTNGLNALSPTLTGYGSAVNNIAQRVASSLGVAGLGALVSVETAQANADYGVLIQAGRSVPGLQQINTGSPTMLGLYQDVQLHAMATAYDDVLLVTAALSAACIPLALVLKRPTTKGAANVSAAID
jgi:EmrB/QacA subfamily drug resistance transporter